MSKRPGAGRRSDYAQFEPIQTRWMDNDVYGHVNNVIHYSYFDTAVNGWLIAHGLLDPVKSESYGLVVETGCRYFAEISFPDRVTAGIRIAELGSSSVRFELGLFRNEDDHAAAEGHFVHVYVDRKTHRPTPIRPKVKTAFKKLMKPELE